MISFWRDFMKKQLLTTTALVAAGVLTITGSAIAAKPTLKLGGSTEQIFGMGSNSDSYDAANGKKIGFDQHSDGEVHFKGSATVLGNVKISTRVELESNSGDIDTDGIDEHWMRISGDFGEIRLGSGDAAAQAMTTGYLGGWSTGVGQNHAFDTGDWVTKPSTVSASTIARVDASSDAEHISYFTPRTQGLQFGISYIPTKNEDVQNRALASTDDTEGWSVGVNYNKKFGGIGLGVAAGYATANESTLNKNDPEITGFGVKVDFSGFRVGMSMVESEDPGTAASTGSNGQKTFEAGAKYTMGAHAFSVQYLNGKATSRDTARSSDETTLFWLAYRRTLGPGVSWKVSAIFADFQDGASGAAAGNSNDGSALTTAIQVRF
jgi:hypothetical protein